MAARSSTCRMSRTHGRRQFSPFAASPQIYGRPISTAQAAQCQGLYDVCAAPDAAVHENLSAPRHRVGNSRERFERCRGGVQVPSSMIRDDDRRNAVLDRELCIFGRQDALQDQWKLWPGNEASPGLSTRAKRPSPDCQILSIFSEAW